MSTYSVRCKNSKCRHRRVTKIHPFDYKVGPACPACGSTSGWRIEGRQYTKNNLCHCNGPIGRDGPFPHKKNHPFCDHHPQGIYNQMKRAGIPDSEIPLEFLGRQMKDTDEVPF